MTSQEELLKYKKRVDSLSEKTKESHKLLMGLCKEISFAKNLNSIDKSSSEADNLADNLIYGLSERIIDHLTYTNSLLSVYEEYSRMLEKLIPQAKTGKEEGYRSKDLNINSNDW